MSEFKNIMELAEQLANSDTSIHIEQKDGCINMKMKGAEFNIFVLLEDVVTKTIQNISKDDIKDQLELANIFCKNLTDLILQDVVKKEIRKCQD